MVGFDRTLLSRINAEKVLEDIKSDVRTDFIFAPHLNAIFVHAGDEVWNRSAELLKNGSYQPSLPYTISVPKGRGFTRPGSILSPVDRFVYQALIDIMYPVIEAELDRTRVFSRVVLHNDQEKSQSAHECWQNFQVAIQELCHAGGHIVKADIANYFKRIPQHQLINLSRAAGCLPEAVNLLEEMLLAFQGRKSFGIVQGLFPSDILGDFYMSNLDAYFEIKQIRSARYNDDIYLQYSSYLEAQRGFVDLIERLRKDGLHLNEYKSVIWAAQDTMREETEVETLFAAAREEIREELTFQLDDYGFEVEWELEDEEELDEETRLAAVEQLYGAIEDYPNQTEKIEKFCLPLLRSAGSDKAIEGVLRRLTQNGHMARYYHAYLSRFVKHEQELKNQLEDIVNGDDIVTDYEKMYLLGSLFNAESIRRETVNKALRWLTSTNQIAEETRAVAAVFAAKHGTASQKHTVRVAYEDEPSEYVRSAILYSSKHMTAVERKTCKRAWGGHSMLNALTAQAM